jgi:DNA-binding PucR family transcriptional regulator
MRKIAGYQLSEGVSEKIFSESCAMIFESSRVVTVLSKSHGYFEIEEEDLGLIEVLMSHLNQTLGIVMTVVITHRWDEVAWESLNVAIRHNKGNMIYLADVLLYERIEQESACFIALDKQLESLPRELIQTAEAFIASGCKATLAASRLYIHRNTFAYRLNQFIEKTQLDIRDFHHARLFQLWWLIKSRNN